MKNQSSGPSITGRDCQRKEELITFLYGECTPAEEQSFKRHLNDCAGCRQEMTEFGVARESLQQWQLPASPRLTLDLAAERPRSLREILAELAAVLPGWFKYSAAFAGAVAVALVFLSVINTQFHYDKEKGFSVQLALFNRPVAAEVNNEAAARELVAKLINEKVTEKESKLEQELEIKRAQFEQQLRKQIDMLTEELTVKNSSELSRAAMELKRQHREELQRALFEMQRQGKRSSDSFEDDPFSLWGGLDEKPARETREHSYGGN